MKPGDRLRLIVRAETLAQLFDQYARRDQDSRRPGSASGWREARDVVKELLVLVHQLDERERATATPLLEQLLSSPEE